MSYKLYTSGYPSKNTMLKYTGSTSHELTLTQIMQISRKFFSSCLDIYKAGSK